MIESVQKEALQKRLNKNLPLHIVLETEVRQTPFGTITVNVEVRDGVADLTTINVVKSRRRKYDLTKDKNSDIR